MTASGAGGARGSTGEARRRESRARSRRRRRGARAVGCRGRGERVPPVGDAGVEPRRRLAAADVRGAALLALASGGGGSQWS